MENNNFYKEYNNPNGSISFVSKTRKFYERHFGVTASRVGYFFKKLGKGFKDRFVIEEEPIIEETVVTEEPIEEVQYVAVDKNKELFTENVKLAHIIDDLFKENKSMNFDEELSELKKLVNQLNDANKENNYLELGRINNRLRVLNAKVLEKIEKTNIIITPVQAVSIEHTETSPFVMDTKKEEKEEKTNPFVMNEEKNTKIEEKNAKIEEKPVEIKALIVKEPVVKKSNDVSKIKSKISLFDRKIAALESKVALEKGTVKEVVGNITKIDKILNEENLDSRETRMYKELRDERIVELNKALAKRDETKKALEAVKVEKALYEQSNIEIDVPQKNGQVFKKEIRVKDYLEQKARDEELAKAKKEQIKREKLEKEIAALKAKLAEKEAKLNAIENVNDTIGYNSKVETTYTPEEYHELIVNMHKKSFY